MSKQKLVVVGNGMAGARAVEEVLARGGADRFDIVMFGDEPYGNYNRIMLSNILSGQQKLRRHLHQHAGLVRRERHHPVFGRAVVNEINRFGKYVVAENGVQESYDVPADRDRVAGIHAADPGLHMEDRSLKPGVFGFRTIDDTLGMVAAAPGNVRW